MLKNLKKYPVVLFFGLVLYVVSFADLFTPVKKYSELENRQLATFPKFSWVSLKENKYTPKIEDFTEDHFFARDQWISLKSISESFLGKKENNNIVYGKNGYMFTKNTNYNEQRVEKNINALCEFFDRHPDRNIQVMLVPTAPGVLVDYVYPNSPVLNTDAVLDTVFAGIGAQHAIDLRPVLKNHAEEYIYYRTDHHWTTLGAFYGYEAYMNRIGRTPQNLNSFTFIEVPDFFGTHQSKAKSFNAQSDILSYIQSDAKITIDEKTDSIYDTSKLDTRDKYAMFLRSNNGYSTIKGTGTGKIMIIKDSYANCLIPYMISDFEQIDIFDMRYIALGLDQFISQNNYDEILFIYNAESFVNDGDLPKINLFNK